MLCTACTIASIPVLLNKNERPREGQELHFPRCTCVLHVMCSIDLVGAIISPSKFALPHLCHGCLQTCRMDMHQPCMWTVFSSFLPRFLCFFGLACHGTPNHDWIQSSPSFHCAIQSTRVPHPFEPRPSPNRKGGAVPFRPDWNRGKPDSTDPRSHVGRNPAKFRGKAMARHPHVFG